MSVCRVPLQWNACTASRLAIRSVQLSSLLRWCIRQPLAPTRPHSVRRRRCPGLTPASARRTQVPQSGNILCSSLALSELLQSVLSWRRAQSVREALGCLEHSLSHAPIAHNPPATAALHLIQTSHHIRRQLLDLSTPTSSQSPPVFISFCTDRLLCFPTRTHVSADGDPLSPRPCPRSISISSIFLHDLDVSISICLSYSRSLLSPYPLFMLRDHAPRTRTND